MTTLQKKAEKSTSELDLVLSELTNDQIRFVVVRQEYSTDKEAAEAIDILPNTVYKWKRSSPIDEAVRLMALDGLVTAQHIRRRNLAKAMAVKVSGLDSDVEKLRQDVATELIEWEMGRATQRNEHGGSDGGPIPVQVIQVVGADPDDL